MTHLSLLAAMTGIAGIVAVASPGSTQRSAPIATTTTAAAAPSRTGQAPADAAWLNSFGRYNIRKGTFHFFQKPDGC